MQGRRPLAFLAGIASVVVGCGAILGSDPDTADGDDAAARPPEDGGGGVATDADAPPSFDDGGGDANKKTTFCTMVNAAFCADFDDGEPVEAGFSSTFIASAMTLLVPSDASAPNAYGARIIENDASAAGAIMSRDVARGGKPKILVDLDMNVGTTTEPNEYMAVLSVVLTRTPVRYLAITLTNKGSSIAIFNPNLTTVVSAGKIPVGWFHLHFEVDVAQGGARLLYDGSPVAATDAGIISQEFGFSVDVGIYVNSALLSYGVDYDNVVVNLAD